MVCGDLALVGGNEFWVKTGRRISPRMVKLSIRFLPAIFLSPREIPKWAAGAVA